MTNKDAVIKMYEALPEEMRPTFANMCSGDDKVILNEYLDVMKQDNLLEKDKITPLNLEIQVNMSKVALLCEYGLEKSYSYWFKEADLDTTVNTLSRELKGYTDNPVIKEIQVLVDKIQDVCEKCYNSIDQSLKPNDFYKEYNEKILNTKAEINEIYKEYKDNLSKLPFEENRTNYIEAGVSLMAGNFDFDKPNQVDVRYCFPIILAETYRNLEPDNNRDNDIRGGYLYPLDVCSKEEYLELNSKVDLYAYSSNDKETKIEKLLDVSKYEKIKYEIDNPKLENLEMKDNISNESKLENEMNIAIETDSAYENNSNETIENEIDNLEDNNNDYYDSYDSYDSYE